MGEPYKRLGRLSSTFVQDDCATDSVGCGRGNREALLDAAKRCLFEKGYANTTARDIATSAGTSLAAIGYHYGSTEALLNAAMIEAMASGVSRSRSRWRRRRPTMLMTRTPMH